MKWWNAVLAALWVLLPPPATAADDLPGAARELARKTAAFAGRGEAVSVTWRNLSSLNPADLEKARGAFETVLRESGVRIADSASAEARITLSENASQYLLVGEARRGEERQVWVAGWKRGGRPVQTTTGFSLEKRLVWEQDDPILDVAFAGETMIVLSPDKLTWVMRQGGAKSAAISGAKNWPRDMRGHIRATATGFEAFLPGMVCQFTAETTAVACRASNEPWTLESGGHDRLLAGFEASRNYFDGQITLQNGQRKNVPPFYSAAAVEENGASLWLLALVDGRTRIFDPAFDPVNTISGWGSDIAGTNARCGSGSQVLATRAGDALEADAIQAFAIVNRSASPLGPSLELPGPVTALWPSGGSAAIAVVRDLATGRYEAYLITVACGS